MHRLLPFRVSEHALDGVDDGPDLLVELLENQETVDELEGWAPVEHVARRVDKIQFELGDFWHRDIPGGSEPRRYAPGPQLP